jgi:hypothetical protein
LLNTSKVFRIHAEQILKNFTHDKNPTEEVRRECRRLRISAGWADTTKVTKIGTEDLACYRNSSRRPWALARFTREAFRRNKASIMLSRARTNENSALDNSSVFELKT